MDNVHHYKPMAVWRNPHTWYITAIMIACSIFYYLHAIIHFTGWPHLHPVIFQEPHDLHRLLFFIPVLYAAYIFRVRGVIVIALISLLVFLPHALFISLYPEPLIRAIVFVITIGMVGILLSRVLNGITERKRMEEELRSLSERESKSAKEWQELFDASTDVIALISPDFEILRINRAGYEGVGKTREELIGKKCYEVVHGLDSPIDSCPCQDLIRTKKAGVGEITQGGRHYIATASPVLDKNGELIAFAHTVKDITERKRMEEALRESEERLQLMFESVTDGITVTDLNGVITEVNQKILEIYGVGSKDEVLGKSAFEFITPGNHERAMMNMQKTLEQGAVRGIEYTLIRADGSGYPGEISASVLKDASGNPVGFIAITRDITERKQIEEKLRLLSHSVESSVDGMAMGDLNGKITYVNKAFVRMFGYSKEELIGKEITFIWSEDQIPKLKEAIKATMEGGWTGELIGKRKDGELFPIAVSSARVVDDKGNVIAIMANHRDITERKRMEEALRREKETFQVLVDEFPIGVSAISKNGHYEYVNPKFIEIFGYSLEDIPTGREWFAKAYPDQEYRNQVISTWVADQKGSKHGEPRPRIFTVTCKDGSERVVKFTPVTIGAEKQLVTYEDITERKRMEKALMEKTKELEAASQLKSEFLAGMSHELRTPLNSVIGFSELMLDGVPGEINDEQRQCLNDILSSGQHLLNLVNDVLDLSKVEAGKMELKPENLSLADVIDDVAQTVKPMLDDNRHKLGVSVEEGLPPVCADKNRLRQIFLNLLSNAINFTPAGGQLSIEVSRQGDWCQVSMIDNGIGIRKDDQERIFEPFCQLDNPLTKEKTGTGLGLTLVNQIIEKHGGRIWVESEHGKGSRFTFILPLATTA